MVVAGMEVADMEEETVAVEMQQIDLDIPVALTGRSHKAGWGRLDRWV